MNQARTLAWLVLAMCFVVLLINSGARFSIGLVLKPMTDELDWSRTAISSAVTMFMVITAASLPFMGRLVDRFGARRVLTTSLAVSAGALAVTPLASSPWQFFVLYGVFFAIGSAGTSITPIGVMLSRWFPDRLGMANSIAISGMGLGQLLVIATLTATLTEVGWRGAYWAIALATLMVCLCVGFLPSEPAAAESTDSAKSAEPPVKFRDALKNRDFQWLLGIYAVCGFQDFLIATHIVAFALDSNVDATIAGNMLALMGLAGLAGVLLAGWLNDRRGPLEPTAACFLLRIVIFGILASEPNPTALVISALLFGATFWATAPLTIIFARRLFGAAMLGVASGSITMIHHASGGLGALTGALSADVFGNYQTIMTLGLAMSVVTIAMCWPLRGTFSARA